MFASGSGESVVSAEEWRGVAYDGLTSLKDKGGRTTGICEDTVEKVVRGEAEGYEGQREGCWEPWAHCQEVGTLGTWLGYLRLLGGT